MILVTGANGQLGRCFAQLVEPSGSDQFIFAGSAELDITDAAAVKKFFNDHPVRWCINCAAYTAVDKAESEPERAEAVNVQGVKLLAAACARNKAQLIHFSTDYVYHSRQNIPFKEDDPVRPQSVYARTKLAGERAALRALPGSMIIRTSWVYAPFGHNFLLTMLRLGAERPSLNVVFDQIGTPTYAPDLAGAVLELIHRVDEGQLNPEQLAGIWHYAGEGVASWYDFAAAIFEMSGLSCRVNPIETFQYPTPAKRPPFSVLNKNKIKQAFALDVPHWRSSLAKCLEQLGYTG